MTIDGTGLQRAALETARSLPGVEEGYPFTEGLLVFKVVGHVFLIVTEDPEEQIITVKSEPPHVDALVREHPSAQPGRYLDKHHWVSIGPGESITRALVGDLVRDSYSLVVEGLPRHDRDHLTPSRGASSSDGS
ncbi:MmcQ/YjbR family DNA-binding protein [Micromonospora fulviviridis]|uniref:MmcQ/YjbR family DNA-binding protein n=1 Tax=Micromonospora fulviviridis TaxID=47860 RepID=UPI00379E51AD